MKKIYILCLISFVTFSVQAQSQWVQIGEKINRFLVVGDTIIAVQNANKLIVSADKGASWSDQFPLPWNEDGSANTVWTPFYTNGHFYAYGHNSQSGFFRTTDSIENWERIEEGLPMTTGNGRLQGILRAFALNGKLYAYTGIASGENRRTVMSTDEGDSWTVKAENLPDYSNFITNGEVILAGNTDGIFQSMDDAQTFERVGSHSFSNQLRTFEAEGDTIAALLRTDASAIIEYTLDFGENWNSIDITALLGTDYYMSNIRLNGSKLIAQYLNEAIVIDLKDETYSSLGTPKYLWLGVAEKEMSPFNFQIVQDTLYAVGVEGTTEHLFKTGMNTTATSTEEGEGLGPTSFELYQNYPNPFNPSTNISFSLNKPGTAEVSVYNELGMKVATLAGGHMSEGTHHLTFNATGLASGVYFYELKFDNRKTLQRMTLIK